MEASKSGAHFMTKGSSFSGSRVHTGADGCNILERSGGDVRLCELKPPVSVKAGKDQAEVSKGKSPESGNSW